MFLHIIALFLTAVMFSNCTFKQNPIRSVSSDPEEVQSSPSYVPGEEAVPVIAWEDARTLDSLQSPEGFRSWLAAAKRNGINTIFVKQPLFRINDNSAVLWKEFVLEAHRQSLRVSAVLNLREQTSISMFNNWNDLQLNSSTSTLTRSTFPDLLHKGYQAAIRRLILQLSMSQVDLIIFRFDPPSGLFDGFTKNALNAFEKDFDQPISPEKLFALTNGQLIQYSNDHIPLSKVLGELSPKFWRWVGWKNRQYLDALQGIMVSVKEQYPKSKFGIELHASTIIDSRGALVRYTEDFLETRQRSFDYFIVSEPESVLGSTRQSMIGEASLRMTALLDDPSKVLVLLSSKRPTWMTLKQMHTIKGVLGLQEGVGFGLKASIRKDFKILQNSN